MFQRGTGERFKYKEAVLEKYPNAICIKLTYKNGFRYHVKTMMDGKPLSDEFKSAENAWGDAWLKSINGK